ncbi:metallophosphoesterase [Maribacter sp. ACAM166]|uniref:metallophosphoesterase n=1 Tax=Maribacter sp. ACAM166 TaxID=2508996 RepID=UPI0010FDE6F5|nr:metallophosphoesterase [Maribacter sp. ACAM166]TLP81218.1 metallophosphoesterase [Maribacter sp. ACAM166]
MAIGRRAFVKRFMVGLTSIIALTALDAFWFEKYIIDWKEFDMSENNPDPISIIQLSDIHLKEINFSLKSIAEKVNKLHPDVLLFTGDTIARSRFFNQLEPLLSLFSDTILKIAILGNKEYTSKISLLEFERIFKKHNGQVLVNENLVYTKGDRTINILGIDDLIEGNADFTASIKTIKNRDFSTIILNHCPAYKDQIDLLNQKENVNITAILSGHTHGGQITFFGKKIYTPAGSGDYLRGWYNNTHSKMYVSKGIGTTILPIRFFARAEASIFYI